MGFTRGSDHAPCFLRAEAGSASGGDTVAAQTLTTGYVALQAGPLATFGEDGGDLWRQRAGGAMTKHSS